MISKFLVGILCLCSLSFSYDFSSDKTDTFGSIRILDVKTLDFDTLNEIEFKGISALAYDEKRGLFALSDFGYLYRLNLNIKNEKIKEIVLKEAYVLSSKKGKKLKKKKRDAEGMQFSEDGLIISFERHPKISLFNFKGRKIKNFDLPKKLQDIKHYQKKNRALEALVVHPKFGLITAPEAPLKNQDKKVHTLYSKTKTWKFKASYKITALELLPDNNLLVLERKFSYLQGYKISLKKVNIMQCKKEFCLTETLAVFKSKDGFNLDNFEGLTHIKDNLYLMISDDNDNPFQETLLVLFELVVL